MGLDIYLNIQKKDECIDKNELQELKNLETKYINAHRKNSNTANLRKKIYKDKMNWTLFYNSRVHKYMKRIDEEYRTLQFQTYDRIHQWLNTDDRLYYLFHEVFKNNHIDDEYTKTKDDDYFYMTIKDLKEVYDSYKGLDNVDNQNIKMMEEVIDKYTLDYDIKFSWWI